MADDNSISPLDLLRQMAGTVLASDRARFSEIYELLASTSPLLFGLEEGRKYSERIAAARHDLVAILERMPSDDERVGRLLKHYGRDEA